MKKLLRNNAIFIGLSLTLILVLGLALLCLPKEELHLLLCDRHTPARDLFYHYYTHIAEWLPYCLCLLVFIFGRAGDAAMAATSIACSELTTQIIKHIVQAPRPITWFTEHFPDIQLPLVDGVRMNHYISFPSGHTTSFFALFFVLSIIATENLAAKRPYSVAIQLLLFIAAALGGYSRIYLCQHFALDVFGGIVVGLLISTLCYAIFSRYEDKKWYNYCLLTKKMT